MIVFLLYVYQIHSGMGMIIDEFSEHQRINRARKGAEQLRYNLKNDQ